MAEKTYSRLTLQERTIIETLLNENRNKSYIAKALNRSRSTVTREINLWVKNPEDKYNSTLAHWNAQDENFSKRNCDKIDCNPKLKNAVYRGLLRKESPELISGRLRIMHPNDPSMQLSHESIYKHIYNHPQGIINKKLIKLLVRHKSRRKKLKPKGVKSCIKDKVSIDNRPPIIELRQEVGHWEGDLITGLNQSSFIGTIVERKTRYVILIKIPNKKSETVTESFAKNMNVFIPNIRKTMTYDNGTEMANHKIFTQSTGMKVYFAHPYSSWERGTNENTNGLVRRYYPKRTDFNNISENQLLQLQTKLNNRPRKVLGYYTANEMMQLELKKLQNTN